MQSKQTKFIGLVVLIIIIVAGLGVIANKSQGPGKYDAFAKALTASGAQFYGAFWCPHCQAQKAEFGTSKKYLPYVECSNPDQSVTAICKEKKIESYPTWTFKDGITLTSPSAPVVCKPNATADPIAGEPEICKSVASQYYTTWIFPGYAFSIKSPTDPVQKDAIWKFDGSAETTGEVPLPFLAQQIGFTLPQ